MSKPAFTNPPLLSSTTMIATFMRVAKMFRATDFVLRKMLVKGSSDEAGAKVFGDYQATEHDVFVATYSKSGTNWAMQIAQDIIWRGEAEFGHIYEVVAWPDAKFAGIIPLRNDSAWKASPTKKRAIKTTVRAKHLPYSEDALYLSVLRDPKEVLVSAYHFVGGMFELHDYMTIDDWIDMFLSNEFPVGPWPEHAASLWAWRERPNVLIIPFKDLKADLPGQVTMIAERMGVSLTSDEHARVVERASFAHMKSWEDKYRPPRFRFTKKPGQMIRSGRSGNSGELLSRKQQAQIDRYCMDRLKELGSDLPYEELFEVVRD